MKFTFKRLENPPDDIAESEVRICSSQYEKLTGQKASANRLKPWKGRVVRVTQPEGGAIYRLLKGHGNLSIPGGICWMGPKSRSQLDVHHNTEVEIKTVNPWWGRILFYNNHLDDAVRFSFRIGFWGVILAVVSLGLSLISILKS